MKTLFAHGQTPKILECPDSYILRESSGVFIGDPCRRLLNPALPVHPVLRAEFAPRRRRDGFIFPGRFGGGVNPATVATWTGEVAEAAGIGHVCTHQLRHTSLTTALDNTENLRSVMEFARHSRAQITAGYTRTTKEQLRTVSDALDFG